jgi:anaerobic magnesium-protoporphyrin IX monomethyl ester cyclase
MRQRRKNNMKIVLIEPKGTSPQAHAGLAYLAGALKDIHDLHIYDLNLFDCAEEELGRQLAQFKPELVGISIKSANVNKAFKLAELVKKNTAARLIGGGPHITLCGLEFLKQQEKQLFDYGLASEAEISFPKFCQELEKEKPNWQEVPGLIYQENGEWRENPAEFPADLDGLELPDYASFQKADFEKTSYPLLTSRGCPYACVYCSVGKISGRLWRFRTPANIIKELKTVKEKYNISFFSIVDDNFTLDKERVKVFCKLLLETNLNLKWSCPNGIRADRVDAEMAVLMKKAGCEEVSVGIESGEPKVFDQIKKGEALEDIKKAVKILQEAGIKVTGFFIVGLPNDSIKATKKTIKFIQDLKLKVVKWNLLVPYPQTELWEWVKSHGRFLRDFTEGQHFSREGNQELAPVFETKDFTAKQRIRAYKIANLATGSYLYVFKRPKSRILYYLKIFWYLLYYSPQTLIKKIVKKIL